MTDDGPTLFDRPARALDTVHLPGEPAAGSLRRPADPCLRCGQPATPSHRCEVGPGPPIVHTLDAPSAHEAARRTQPKRGTRKAKVLEYLRAHEWVDGSEIESPAVGSRAGTRRLRELRVDGWTILARPKPGASTEWQYRLVDEAPLA